MFCYATYQDLYDKIKADVPDIIFVQGFPSYIESSYLNNSKKHDLLIIDDLLDQVCDNPLFRDAYVRNSHHLNYSIITVTQNPFYKSKYLRTCSLQSTGYIFFRCNRDHSMIRNLGKQIFPRNSSFFMDAYEQITLQPFRYLYVDFTPYCSPALRVRGTIFIDDDVIDVYLPENNSS